MNEVFHLKVITPRSRVGGWVGGWISSKRDGQAGFLI